MNKRAILFAVLLLSFVPPMGLGGQISDVPPNRLYQENFETFNSGQAPSCPASPCGGWYSINTAGSGTALARAPAGTGSNVAWEIAATAVPYMAQIQNTASTVNICNPNQVLAFSFELTAAIAATTSYEMRISGVAASTVSQPVNTLGIIITGNAGTESLSAYVRGSGAATTPTVLTTGYTAGTTVNVLISQVNCTGLASAVFALSGAITASTTYTTTSAISGDLDRLTAGELAGISNTPLQIDDYQWTGPMPAPTVTGTDPSQGSTAGGQEVSVFGTGFFQVGAVNPTVTFDGVSAPATSWVSSTEILAQTPSHAAGAVTVAVTNPDGQSGSMASAYTYASFQADEVTPDRGPTEGGNDVTVTGSGFVEGVTVEIDGVDAGAEFVSETEIHAVAPAHAVGLVDVTVQNPGDSAQTLTDAYSYFNVHRPQDIDVPGGLTGPTVTFQEDFDDDPATDNTGGGSVCIAPKPTEDWYTMDWGNAPGVANNCPYVDTFTTPYTVPSPPNYLYVNTQSGCAGGGDGQCGHRYNPVDFVYCETDSIAWTQVGDDISGGLHSDPTAGNSRFLLQMGFVYDGSGHVRAHAGGFSATASTFVIGNTPTRYEMTELNCTGNGAFHYKVSRGMDLYEGDVAGTSPLNTVNGLYLGFTWNGGGSAAQYVDDIEIVSESADAFIAVDGLTGFDVSEKGKILIARTDLGPTVKTFDATTLGELAEFDSDCPTVSRDGIVARDYEAPIGSLVSFRNCEDDDGQDDISVRDYLLEDPQEIEACAGQPDFNFELPEDFVGELREFYPFGFDYRNHLGTAGADDSISEGVRVYSVSYLASTNDGQVGFLSFREDENFDCDNTTNYTEDLILVNPDGEAPEQICSSSIFTQGQFDHAILIPGVADHPTRLLRAEQEDRDLEYGYSTVLTEYFSQTGTYSGAEGVTCFPMFTYDAGFNVTGATGYQVGVVHNHHDRISFFQSNAGAGLGQATIEYIDGNFVDRGVQMSPCHPYGGFVDMDTEEIFLFDIKQGFVNPLGRFSLPTGVGEFVDMEMECVSNNLWVGMTDGIFRYQVTEFTTQNNETTIWTGTGDTDPDHDGVGDSEDEDCDGDDLQNELDNDDLLCDDPTDDEGARGSGVTVCEGGDSGVICTSTGAATDLFGKGGPFIICIILIIAFAALGASIAPDKAAVIGLALGAVLGFGLCMFSGLVPKIVLFVLALCVGAIAFFKFFGGSESSDGA